MLLLRRYVFLAFDLLLLLATVTQSEEQKQNDKNSLVLIETEDEQNDDLSETQKDSSSENVKPFVATNEWQEVLNGQAVPHGLHYRINLETGKKEAKLLDNQEKKSPDPRDKQYLREELLEAMKLLKSDEVKNAEKVRAPGDNFKTIDQIKKEFSEINMNMKTDYEILKELVSALKVAQTDEEKMSLMTDLEYYVHQYDNAQDFVKLNGFQTIIPYLNSTNPAVRSMVAFLMGSAMQSNPRVQIAGLENMALQELLKLVVHDDSSVAQSRAIYALSCLIRHFPLAQERFIEHGGLTAFANLFRHNPNIQVSEANKLQLKTVTLLTDLLEEQHLTAQNYVPDEISHQEKLTQYSRVRLKEAMVEQGWCDYIPQLLDAPEHDVREKVIRAMITVNEECHSLFIARIPRLKELTKEYEILSEEEGRIQELSVDNRYFLDLYNNVVALLRSIDTTTKDEL